MPADTSDEISPCAKLHVPPLDVHRDDRRHSFQKFFRLPNGRTLRLVPPFIDVLVEISLAVDQSDRNHRRGEICGSPLAVACYAPDAPGRRASGQMVFAVDDPDLTHTLIHEYGHHLDLQHPNLDHLGLCPAGADGTRGWFFAREAEQRISRWLTCDPFAAWDQLIGEAYAEDYVAANGIENWTLRTLPAPSPAQRAALLADLDRPFRPARRAWPAADGARVLEVEHWTFAFVQARARRTRGVALALTPAGERTRRARARRGRIARVTAHDSVHEVVRHPVAGQRNA